MYIKIFKFFIILLYVQINIYSFVYIYILILIKIKYKLTRELKAFPDVSALLFLAACPLIWSAWLGAVPKITPTEEQKPPPFLYIFINISISEYINNNIIISWYIKLYPRRAQSVWLSYSDPLLSALLLRIRQASPPEALHNMPP